MNKHRGFRGNGITGQILFPTILFIILLVSLYVANGSSCSLPHY